MKKHLGPIFTLVAGLVLAAVLMAMNLSVTGASEAGNVADNVADNKAPATTPAATPTTPPTTAAPTTPPPPEIAEITFAGNVSGEGATLAIAVNNGKAVAYLCDGRSAEAWMQGNASAGVLDLSGTGGAKLTGTFGNALAAGTVTATGKQWAFSLQPVAPPSGLYRATANVRNAKLVGGWIVLPNGRQVGVLKLDGNPIPAPPLDVATGTTTVDGTSVSVGAVDGSGL